MSTGETRKNTSLEAHDHERQYAIMGCLGIVRFLQKLGSNRELFEKDVRTKQFYKSFRKLGQLLSKHDKFVKLYESGTLSIKLNHLELILFLMKDGKPNDLSPDFGQAIAFNSGIPLEPEISTDFTRLVPIFEYEVYPFFATPLIDQVFSSEYASGLISNLSQDLPILGDQIEYYVGEYDPKK